VKCVSFDDIKIFLSFLSQACLDFFGGRGLFYFVIFFGCAFQHVVLAVKFGFTQTSSEFYVIPRWTRD